jgi:hypothetical protein
MESGALLEDAYDTVAGKRAKDRAPSCGMKPACGRRGDVTSRCFGA